jgi:DNA-binding IclR family transcriptional regulator
VVSSVGRRLPAFASATGRSLLARLSDEEVAALYEGGLPPAPSVTSPQGLPELFERLAQIRRTGIALSHDEANRGVAAVAVAVGDGALRDEVSLCIVFPAATCDPAERDQIAQELLAGAAEIAGIVNDRAFAPAQFGAARQAA